MFLHFENTCDYTFSRRIGESDICAECRTIQRDKKHINGNKARHVT